MWQLPCNPTVVPEKPRKVSLGESKRNIWLIPSVSPMYGTMLDQGDVIRELEFETVMVLPATFPVTRQGAETGIRRFCGLVGAHASFTLEERTLELLEGICSRMGVGLHIHLAEGPTDREVSHERGWPDPLDRLAAFGLLTLINERVFHHGRHRDPAPLLGIVGASNELPEPDAGLEALYDRFLVRLAVVAHVAAAHGGKAQVESTPGAGKSSAARDLAVQQIVSRAVVSTEIVDILEAAGLETPDISILSDEFLAEVQGMEKKNLAMEALRKLINGEIRSQSRVNVVETRAFSERLEEAIARYHSNAITTAEVIQELIKLAKDIRAAHQRGEEEGLSREEISFYDALAQNESAVEVMGNDQLRVIAHELAHIWLGESALTDSEAGWIPELNIERCRRVLNENRRADRIVDRRRSDVHAPGHRVDEDPGRHPERQDVPCAWQGRGAVPRQGRRPAGQGRGRDPQTDVEGREAAGRTARHVR